MTYAAWDPATAEVVVAMCAGLLPLAFVVLMVQAGARWFRRMAGRP